MIIHLTPTQEKIFSSAFEKLSAMGDDEVIELGVKHPSYNNFIQIGKFIIENAYDWNAGFVLTFNSSYTRVKKNNRFAFAKKIHAVIKTI